MKNATERLACRQLPAVLERVLMSLPYYLAEFKIGVRDCE
jgi:hypothetical protein